MFPFLIPILLMFTTLLTGSSHPVSTAASVLPAPTTTPNRFMILAQDNRDTVRLFYTYLESKNYERWEAMLDQGVGWTAAKGKLLQKTMSGVSAISVVSVEPFRKQGWTLTRRNYQAFLEIASGSKTIEIPSPLPPLTHGIASYIVTLHMDRGEWRVERISQVP